MPTINFSLKDLNSLVGRNLSIEDLDNYSEFAKGEVEGYDKDTDEVSMSFEDTNIPYLWSVEGFAVLLKGIIGIEKGVPQVNVQKSDERIIISEDVKKVRPAIAAFSARGKNIDDYMIKQMIQLQEKLAESFGRRRVKVSVGIYAHKKIKFPVYYMAVDPESVQFTPLEFKRPCTLGEILEVHPTGQKYAFTLKGFDKYPLLLDSDNQILSFPPIINSNDLGKVVVGDDDLLIEVTGSDIDSVELCSNILALAFSTRGFKIYSCFMDYGTQVRQTPNFKTEKRFVKNEEIKNILGFEIDDRLVKEHLEKARYNCSKTSSGFEVEVPSHRGDVMHSVDIIEDIAMIHGYANVPETGLSSYTVGGTSESVLFADRVRSILAGLGFQELISPVLSNPDDLYLKLNAPDLGTIELKEYMSATYSAVRSWILPMLLKTLSANKHNEYPQNIFEEGICVNRLGDEVFEYNSVAACLCDTDVDFTRVKQVLDCVLRSSGIEYSIKEDEHPSFIPGRFARVVVDGGEVGFLGEVSPAVLDNLGILMPVAGMELNLDLVRKDGK